MNRLFTASSTNPRNNLRLWFLPALPVGRIFSYSLMIASMVFLCIDTKAAIAQTDQKASKREPIEMSVVIVNPSNTKNQSVPIHMDLPTEVTPDAIIDSAGLDVEFDAEKSTYYLYKEKVDLKPGETKTFNVEIQDVWVIPQGRLDSLRDQTRSIIKRLEGSDFFDSAQLLGQTIEKSLTTIAVTQDDATVSRRSHIGIYRNNVQIVEQIKDDIERLEKQLVIASSLPKPDVLEQSEIKTESPTKSTSWMIIFIIMLFIGMLAGVFFFTWQTQAHATKNLISEARESAFPERVEADDKET